MGGYIEKGTTYLEWPDNGTLMILGRQLDGWNCYPIVVTATLRQRSVAEMEAAGLHSIAADWRWTSEVLGAWLTHARRGHRWVPKLELAGELLAVKEYAAP